MSRRAPLSLLVLICTLAVGMQACAPKPQEACNFVQNGYGQRVSWQKDPIVLYVDASVPREAMGPIRRALNTWNRTLGGEAFRLVSEAIDGKEPRNDGYSVIYWMHDWEKDRPFEQARTTIYWVNKEIYEADVRVNARNFLYSFAEGPVSGRVDLESLMVHEFGHVLGLTHTAEHEYSVMHAYLSSSSLRREPTDLDRDSLSCEYRVAGLE